MVLVRNGEVQGLVVRREEPAGRTFNHALHFRAGDEPFTCPDTVKDVWGAFQLWLSVQSHAAAVFRPTLQPAVWLSLGSDTIWPSGPVLTYYPFVPAPERPATKTPLSSLPDLLERTYCVLHWSSNYLLFDFLENSAVRNILSEDFWTLDSIIFVYLCVVRSLHFVNCTFWCIRGQLLRFG